MGQTNPSSGFLVRPTVVMHYATKVYETFSDLNVFPTCVDKLNCVSSKSPNDSTLVLVQETFSTNNFASSCSTSEPSPGLTAIRREVQNCQQKQVNRQVPCDDFEKQLRLIPSPWKSCKVMEEEYTPVSRLN